MTDYETYITETYRDIRKGIRAYQALPDTIPTEVKKDIWKALVEALNLVQSEMANFTNKVLS